MADRAKVIYDLERCTCHVPDACRDCSKYNAEGILTLTCMESLMKDALELLEEQKAIVRCKDCKYNSGNCHGLYAQFVTCYKTGSPHREDWYCADGERQ